MPKHTTQRGCGNAAGRESADVTAAGCHNAGPGPPLWCCPRAGMQAGGSCRANSAATRRASCDVPVAQIVACVWNMTTDMPTRAGVK